MIPAVFAVSLLAPAAAAAAAASGSRQITTRGDGIIRARVNAIAGPAPKLRGRQNEITVFNQRYGTGYAVEVDVGTPAQTITLILDTGSPDTWVNPTCETSRSVAECLKYPQFDYTKSSSLTVTETIDVLLYGSGNATIQYAYETLTIGSATIKDQMIGIGLDTHRIPLGILGVSPPVQGENEYPYVLDTMLEQGLIKSRAFSLDLRGVDNPNGALIFGGIDTGKYIGELAKLPMLTPAQSPLGGNRYYVTMTGIGLTLPDGSILQSEEMSLPVFLDSGATLSHLPKRIFDALGASFSEAVFEPENGFYFLPCGITELDGSIDFYFAGKTIRVPLKEFIWQTGDYCILGVTADEEEPVLGDTFLRAAYVVFDQDQRNLHIAQAANCGTNLVAIGSGEDAVPSMTGDCTELPTPTGQGTTLDVTATRPPANTFTGAAPTVEGVGPGPAASKISGTGTGVLQPTGSSTSENAAGRGVESRLGAAAAAAFGLVNVLAWML